jgi:hypothetical protein
MANGLLVMANGLLVLIGYGLWRFNPVGKDVFQIAEAQWSANPFPTDRRRESAV